MTKQLFRGDGFTVEAAGMHSLRYNAHGKSAVAYGETTILDLDSLSTGFVIYAHTIGWEHSQEITGQDRSRIVSGLSEALKAWRVSFEIE